MSRHDTISLFRKMVLFRAAAGHGDTDVVARYDDPEAYLRDAVPGGLGADLAAACGAHRLTWYDVGWKGPRP